MKKLFSALGVAALLAPATGLGAAAPVFQNTEDLKSKDLKTRAAYSLGITYGNMWKNRGVEIDWEAFMQGARDAAAGATLLTETETSDTLRQFETEARAKAAEKMRVVGEENQKKGSDFLAANKDKEGVKATPSGLQYKVLKEGTGAKPEPTDKVTVHYVGTLIDGTEFDSSVKRGAPATFALNQVVKGFSEGLQLMTAGAKYQLFIPSDLAYGRNGPGKIGPNATLVFEVDLLNFEAAPPPAAPQAAATGQPVTSDIIKVPSAEELAKGAKIEVIKAEDVPKLIEEEKKKQQPKPEKP